MKLKKGPKRALIILLVILVLGAVGGLSYFFFLKDSNATTKVLKKIDGYGYTLKASKIKPYKDLFQELDEILTKKKVDEKKYAKTISKMFIYDFYSLDDKIAKTDVGGTDFVNSAILDNFLVNAEDTYYKYVESNIYGKRKQKLPTVDKVKVVSTEKTEFTYGETTDENAYEVEITWNYTNESYDKKYQTSAVLTLVHEDKKLTLVELSEGTDTEEGTVQD